MIIILTTRERFGIRLVELLGAHGIKAEVVLPGASDGLDALYRPEVVAAVVEPRAHELPEFAWLDLLASLGRRIPVVAIGKDPRRQQAAGSGRSHNDAVSWLEDPTAEEVVALLDACGAVGITHALVDRETVPVYNAQVPLHMLQNNGALSVLLIDAGSFRKIGIEYGSEVLRKVQECFNGMLSDLWGTPGSFRSSDILCRRSQHGNTYYVFLEQARSASAVPAPGILEKLADRLAMRLANTFWREIFVERSRRKLPDCINFAPDIAVGFATVVHNPCVDGFELIETMLERALESSRLAQKRFKDRQRELMQTLIHQPGLLTPHYQAVFQLPTLTKELVEQARGMGSLRPLAPLLFGFESLIRVKADAIDMALDPAMPTLLESKYLRPDVLFSLAHGAKLSLELDQACLHHAVLHGGKLPGTLLVNILPRNLYNIDRLRHLIMDRKEIMFEVSESEAINNLELMIKVRAALSRMELRIATDDFGRGYSGLEQIIKIKPDLIKLDRSLIQDIHNDHPKQAFVSGLVRAAKISSTVILAEGVEKWQEAEVLKAMGIDLIQGFLLHRPQAVEVIQDDLGDVFTDKPLVSVA